MCRYIKCEDELVDFLRELFVEYEVLSAVLRVTIEEGIMVLPEIYVQFQSAPRGAEQTISNNIDPFLHRQASQHNSTYRKTLKRIVVEDIDSLEDMLNQSLNDWY